MSSRRQDRDPFEYNRTPEWVINLLLRDHVQEQRVIDFGAGDGVIAARLIEHGCRHVEAYEIQERFERYLKWLHHPDGSVRYVIGDGFKTPPLFGWSVVSNPPFSRAAELVEWFFASRGATPDGALRDHGFGKLYMLQRLAWLESQERNELVRRTRPDLFVMPVRPAFRGGRAVDRHAMAWYVFPGRCQYQVYSVRDCIEAGWKPGRKGAG